MSKPFDALRARLLTAGVAPRHIRRYLAELDDHLHDLRSHEGNEAAALARLGGVEALARDMIGRPEFRSWTARAPWAMFLLAPLGTLVTGGRRRAGSVCVPDACGLPVGSQHRPTAVVPGS